MRFLLPCRLLLGAAIGPKGGTLRHYEVVAIIHPDQHERAEAMAERYKKIVTGGGGVVYRFEDWGRRNLAYIIQNQKQAQYILMNIECDEQTLKNLEESFKFSDTVMRTLIIRRPAAVSEDSPVVKKMKKNKEAAEQREKQEAQEKQEEQEAQTGKPPAPPEKQKEQKPSEEKKE